MHIRHRLLTINTFETNHLHSGNLESFYVCVFRHLQINFITKENISSGGSNVFKIYKITVELKQITIDMQLHFPALKG